MNASSRTAAPAATIPPYQRTPRRVTVTISWQTHQTLLQRSDYEGRSLSNLTAHLIETSLRAR